MSESREDYHRRVHKYKEPRKVSPGECLNFLASQIIDYIVVRA